MTGWTRLAEMLAQELDAAPDTTFLIIGEEPGPSRRFAQFHKTEHGALSAELTGDTHLEQHARPDASGYQAITDAGWQPPDPAHADNWWAAFDWPLRLEHYRRAATMTVTGLHEGFRIADPADLTYLGWVAANGNTTLLLPWLGIPAADREPD